MNEPLDNTAVIKRNRFFGIVIILIVVVPMIAAYLIHQAGWTLSSGTTNKGELLQPPLLVQELKTVDSGDYFDQLYDATENKKWRFLIPVSSSCDDICQKNLYTSRQVHIRLAEKAYRVERMLLALGSLPVDLLNELEKDHPNTRLITSKSEHLSQWLTPTENDESSQNYFYLVDQEGFAMMRYSHINTGQDVLDDIKKLLKFTYDK